MPNVDICLTPKTIDLFDLTGKVVVVVDIFRATSTMTAALSNGVAKVIPVSDLDHCNSFQGNEYIKAAERGGKKVEGFHYGNSPFDYEGEDVKGKTLVMTTTNGTKALNLSKDADQVLIGSFLNASSTLNYLKKVGKDVLIFCAGWKGRFSLEDTLYAGYLAELLLGAGFEHNSDSVFVSIGMSNSAKIQGWEDYSANAAHYRRLNSFRNHEDIKFCMKMDQYDLVAGLVDDSIRIL